MKKKEFLTAVAEISGLSLSVVEAVLRTAGDVVADCLAAYNDEAVRVPGFGTFEPREVLPRHLWRAAPDGGMLPVPGKRGARFRPARRFLRVIEGKE